jgi:hypothetical protein
MDNYHLTPDGGQWKLKKQDAERATRIYDTKEEGVKDSAGFMRETGGSLKIHKLDGTIEEERTYPRSDDPRESKG